MIIGLDIGGHHIAGALVVPGSWTIVPDSCRHKDTDHTASADTLLDTWAHLIEELSAPGLDGGQQVGIAMPGPFDYRAGIALFTGNQKFEALYGVDVRDELSSRIKSPSSFRFLNDASAFAVGSTTSILPRPKRALALTLGTGLGAAFLEDGIPVIDSASGEVPEDGCLWHLPFRDSIADDYVSSRWIIAQARARMGLECTVASLASAAKQDRLARAIFVEYGLNLAAIIAPWVRSFAPDIVVIGGRITRAFHLFSRELNDGLAKAGASARIVIHENTEDAAIVGGAKTFDETFWTIAQTRLPAK